jgi:hypothetical protein
MRQVTCLTAVAAQLADDLDLCVTMLFGSVTKEAVEGPSAFCSLPLTKAQLAVACGLPLECGLSSGRYLASAGRLRWAARGSALAAFLLFPETPTQSCCGSQWQPTCGHPRKHDSLAVVPESGGHPWKHDSRAPGSCPAGAGLGL